MSFSTHNCNIALCNNVRVVIYNIENKSSDAVDLPDQPEKKSDSHNNVEIEMYHMITSVAFSNDGKYFLVCTNRKQLCLYETESLKLLSNRSLARAASRVRFTPNNDIILADKAGDVYLFSTSNPTEDGRFVLGHLSMLLDVLVTHDQKYVITTDRDEKIRISMLPNSYNILSYCLRHTKFVTNICELPHDNNILVSAGGDGLLILWDYTVGKDLLCIDFHDKISKEDVEKFNQSLLDRHLEEIAQTLPVKHLRLSMLDEKISLAVLSFHNNPLLLVYKIDGNIHAGFKGSYLQSIIVDSEPMECLLYNQNLWVLTNSGFKVYEFISNFVPNQALMSSLKDLDNSWETLRRDTLNQNLFPILYKRKYDNVQEYLERKKLRLDNITEQG